MLSRIKKWGNSAAIRLPANILLEAGLQADSKVNISNEEGRIIIEKSPDLAQSLDELLAGISDENLHNEVDFGPARGKESF
ncbi:MAG: AbrB/MazE/SpoVT family DNA-binding domain-containing protein [Pseudomonadota bacterium]